MRRTALLTVGVLCLVPNTARAQEGSDWARVAGGALGLYSGAVLGSLGGLVPCSQTYAGAWCVQAAGAVGGAIALGGGIYLGGVDEDAVTSAARGAGYGLLIGSAAGFVLKEAVPRLGWNDVVAGGLIGTAIGASAEGAALGLAAGSVVGGVLYLTVPSFDFPNSAGVALTGMAVGGIGSWIVRSVDANSKRAADPISFSIRLKV